ncbi:hypothetical protein GIB67_031887 [Kingdonia uniflora]|uniref:Aminotransferase class V domain-containing protein n=1 Tax=Kingdonia uniflora TaxID=39325 RepID=A0A7J7NTK0_9MAGN|nr:hypothetical protein GIB67_031887 [Kingdonia uniflora]
MLNKDDSVADKFAWLRLQVIGGEVEFQTPFGQRALTYADHTATGRSIHYIENYIMKDVLPFYGNTHTRDSYVGQKTTKMVNEATKYIKKCLGGGSKDAIIFCGSGATAAVKRLQEVMAVSVPSTLRDKMLKCLLIEEQWVVFVGPYEHHSNLLSWRQSLVEVVEVGLDEQGLVDMESLRLELESYKFSNRPMLGSFSACSNVTGIYSNTRALARLLHEYGAFVCFDFAASGPYVEIDMRSGDIEGYDAIFLAPHKFLGEPGSPGILLMSKALYHLKSCPPSTCGGGTVDYVNGFNEKDTLYNIDVEEREDAGTPMIIQKIRAAMAFWVKECLTYTVIEAREQVYIKTALKRLLPNPNLHVLGNTSVKRQPIISFLVYSTSTTTDPSSKGKPLHGSFVVTLLNDLFGIQARGGCACAGPYGHHLLGVSNDISLAHRNTIEKGYVGVKPGWTRVSFSYYMSKEEFDFLLEALEFMAMYAERFLRLYHFNWKTGNWAFRRKSLEENLIGVEFHIFLSLTGHKQTPEISSSEANKGLESENKDAEVISKYTSYLEIAKRIASSLPESTPQRNVPKDIDNNIIYYRI